VTTRRSRAFAAAALGLCASSAAGCGRKLTSAECEAVASRIEAAYRAEVKQLGPHPIEQSQGAAVIEQEAARVRDDWLAECQREVLGKPVDERELRCMLEASTLEDVRKCDALP
jgi:hypothetical protein